MISAIRVGYDLSRQPGMHNPEDRYEANENDADPHHPGPTRTLRELPDPTSFLPTVIALHDALSSRDIVNVVMWPGSTSESWRLRRTW